MENAEAQELRRVRIVPPRTDVESRVMLLKGRGSGEGFGPFVDVVLRQGGGSGVTITLEPQGVELEGICPGEYEVVPR